MSGPGAYLVGKEERESVLEVIDSKHLFRYGNLDDPTFTKKVYTLEREFSNYIGVNYCVATVSGTMALYNALKTLGIGEGDEVLVPGYTYVASFTAVISVGAVPVLTEIDESLTIDPDDILRKITTRTKCIMPVHMIGNSCDMGKIISIANKHNLYVVEDCCQAAGASYKGKKVGTFGDFAAFSLNYYKTITAGDGGLLVTNDKFLYESAFAFHDQGHVPSRAESAIGNRNIIGLNLRMNELTGAVALAQLRKIDSIVETLRKHKKLLKNNVDLDPKKTKWRIIHDDNGECASILTMIFNDSYTAKKVADILGTVPISESGWHVYSNMEHINNHLETLSYPNGFGALPNTDSLLERSINIGIGVIDAGLGSGFGININSHEAEIMKVAVEINQSFSCLE